MEKEIFTKGASVLYQSRYCDQEKFDLVIAGVQYDDEREKMVSKICNIMYPSYTTVTTLVPSSNYTDKVLTSCSSVWITRTQETNNYDVSRLFPENYGVTNNIVRLPDSRIDYCACSFMKCLYVFGGLKHMRYNALKKFSTCKKYSLITGKWRSIPSLKILRYSAACTVFGGKIVVSGGYNTSELTSVEAYDHHFKNWTTLPDMIESRYDHGAVSMGNKMFVIGGKYNLTCEVLNSVSRKFTCIRQLLIPENVGYAMSGLTIGYKIIDFPKYTWSTEKKSLIYDVLTDKWEVKEIELISTNRVHSCSRLPIF